MSRTSGTGANNQNAGGNDIIFARETSNQNIRTNGGSDIIYSAAGVKTINGGAGADVFVWPNTASLSGLDVVQDFTPSQGDQLNLGALVSFNPQTDNPANFVRVSGTTLQVYSGGLWVDVATLNVLTPPFDAAALYASGNLLL